MKSFGQMTVEEAMKVLLYGELNGEKAIVDPRIRAGSLMRLVGTAREELRKAQSVVDDANPKGHNWEVYKDPAGAKRSATEIYREWTGIRDMWRKLVKDAEMVIDGKEQPTASGSGV